MMPLVAPSAEEEAFGGLLTDDYTMTQFTQDMIEELIDRYLWEADDDALDRIETLIVHVRRSRIA